MDPAKSFHEMMADKMSGGTADAGSDDGSEEPDYGEGLKSAVESFIDAVHSKDVDAATDALKSAVTLCNKEPDGDEGGSAPAGHSALLLIPHGKGK